LCAFFVLISLFLLLFLCVCFVCLFCVFVLLFFVRLCAWLAVAVSVASALSKPGSLSRVTFQGEECALLHRLRIHNHVTAARLWKRFCMLCNGNGNATREGGNATGATLSVGTLIQMMHLGRVCSRSIKPSGCDLTCAQLLCFALARRWLTSRADENDVFSCDAIDGLLGRALGLSTARPSALPGASGPDVPLGLDFRQWLRLLRLMLFSAHETSLLLFQALDLDGDGVVSPSDIKGLVAAAGCTPLFCIAEEAESDSPAVSPSVPESKTATDRGRLWKSYASPRSALNDAAVAIQVGASFNGPLKPTFPCFSPSMAAGTESTVSKAAALESTFRGSSASNSAAPALAAPDLTVPPFAMPTLTVPESRTPESDAPESRTPESDAPESDAPESDAPESDAPESDAAHASSLAFTKSTDASLCFSTTHVPVSTHTSSVVSYSAALAASSAPPAPLRTRDASSSPLSSGAPMPDFALPAAPGCTLPPAVPPHSPSPLRLSETPSDPSWASDSEIEGSDSKAQKMTISAFVTAFDTVAMTWHEWHLFSQKYPLFDRLFVAFRRQLGNLALLNEIWSALRQQDHCSPSCSASRLSSPHP